MPFDDGNAHAGPGQAMGKRGTGLTCPNDDGVERGHGCTSFVFYVCQQTPLPKPRRERTRGKMVPGRRAMP